MPGAACYKHCTLLVAALWPTWDDSCAVVEAGTLSSRWCWLQKKSLDIFTSKITHGYHLYTWKQKNSCASRLFASAGHQGKALQPALAAQTRKSCSSANACWAIPYKDTFFDYGGSIPTMPVSKPASGPSHALQALLLPLSAVHDAMLQAISSFSFLGVPHLSSLNP